MPALFDGSFGITIERQDHSIHMSSALQVQQLYTAGIATFVGGILTDNGQ